VKLAREYSLRKRGIRNDRQTEFLCGREDAVRFDLPVQEAVTYLVRDEAETVMAKTRIGAPHPLLVEIADPDVLDVPPFRQPGHRIHLLLNR